MIDSIPIHLEALASEARRRDLHQCLSQYYRGSKYMRVIESDSQDRLTPDALNGTNYVELRVHGNETTSQVVLTARYDNLGKGASGAATQNVGLMLGIDVSSALKSGTIATSDGCRNDTCRHDRFAIRGRPVAEARWALDAHRGTSS